MTLARLLEGAPGEVVVYRDDTAATREQLAALAGGLSSALRANGRSGHAIGVLMPNVPATVAAWFGIWQAGCAFVPLNPRVPATELTRTIERTSVSAVVTEPALAQVLPSDAEVLDGGGYALRGLTPAAPRTVAPQDAIIQFTSGTTGQPKAVVLRHDTIGDLLDTVIGSLRGNRRDQPARMPNLVPVSLALWAGIYQVLFAFRLGAPVVLMDRFEPREFARLVAEYGIRSSVLPPAALVMLNQDPAVESLAPLRYVRSVSAPLAPSQARRFHDRFGIAVLNGYGQTELGGEAVGWSAEDWKRYGTAKLGSVGRPHPAFELRVRGEGEELVGHGEVGELEIRSSSALPGEDASMAGRVTDDGWLRTGDLARIDDDGFVWIEGRVSSMINRGGLKVFPDEVEDRIHSFPGVRDAAVAGVPDARLGEVPWAFVVPASGEALDAEALREWCRAALAPYKVPAGVTIIDAVPRNEIGKILRQDLVPLAGPASP